MRHGYTCIILENQRTMCVSLLWLNFHRRPSALDAKVFGCLVPLMKAPLKSNKLSNHLRGCDNLFGFCNRIMMRYFPSSPEGLC